MQRSSGWILVMVVGTSLGCGSGTNGGTDAGPGADVLTIDTGGRDDAGGGDDAGCSDMDMDGVCDDEDICANGPDDVDADGDTVPDACDLCPEGDDTQDADADGTADACDCDAAACQANASCTETPMALVTCTCDEGYEASGEECTPVDCGALTEPENGTLTVDTTTFGSEAMVSCDAGFTLVGDAVRTCLADGWSGDEPLCTSVDCGPLDPPTNGAIDLPSTGFSAVATYSCEDGHVLEGEVTRTCQMDETWSGAAPTCRFVDCGGLSAPVEGMVDTDRTSFGGTASYTCNPGHTLMGDPTRSCGADGAWTGAEPSCEPVDCGGLSAPANGAVDAMFTTFGSIASYFCNGGYTLIGDDTRTCTEDGVWSGVEPICERDVVDCGPPPTVANGVAIAPVTTVGETAVYRCNSGYQELGGHRAVCLPDGTWLGDPPICALELACSGCGTVEGERVRATTAMPSGARNVLAGRQGTLIAGQDVGATLPNLIQWDAWSDGHNGNCGIADCGTCRNSGSGRWWTACDQFETQRLTCACEGAFTPGDRVVALFNSPSGAGVTRGTGGTVVGASTTGDLNILIRWDGWSGGHNGNCSFSTCGDCTSLGSNGHWWTNCEMIGRE